MPISSLPTPISANLTVVSVMDCTNAMHALHCSVQLLHGAAKGHHSVDDKLNCQPVYSLCMRQSPSLNGKWLVVNLSLES